MLFHTSPFLAFMLAVLLGHRLLPWKYGRYFLLCASLFFYGCSNWAYIFLLLFCVATSYVAALALVWERRPVTRRIWLMFGIGCPLLVLASFKYTKFFLLQLDGLLGMGLTAQFDAAGLLFLLPVGISFYTFQSVAYVVDVYRGDLPPVRHFPTYALYISFFPQLVAGPIERGANVLPQLESKRVPNGGDTLEAVYLFMRGLVKKVIFADRLGIFVDHMYSLPLSGPDGSLWFLSTLCFAFQIYLDFSAYTDMALGCGRLIGVRLSQNFEYPYLSTSPREFWRRWHITLSSWLRDYLYIPLGGNRRGKFRQYLNVLVVMFIAGLWHGAAWHFVAWGLFMGLLIIGYDIFFKLGRDKTCSENGFIAGLTKGIGALITFFCVTLGWIFFRADSIGDAMIIMVRIFTDFGDWTAPFRGNYRAFTLLCGLLYLTHWLGSRSWLEFLRNPEGEVIRGLAYGLRWGAIAVMLFFGVVERSTQFIYFEF